MTNKNIYLKKPILQKGGDTLLGQQASEDQFRLTLYDYTIAPILSLMVAVWVFVHIGTAVNWDDLLYMSLSQHTVPEAWVLNRYGHIYLQKLFFLLAGDSIIGGRIFWSFIVLGTALLTYWSTRLLVGKKGYICGAIAVPMVLMQSVFGKDAGCTLTDFTVMFLVILTVFIYLLFLNHKGGRGHWLLMALGLLFFWTVKSKEVGICLGVLFLGLGFNKKEDWNIRQFMNDLKWVIVGIAAGCAILMLLDLVFLGDLFFSVRPSNIQAVLGSNIHEPSTKALSSRISMSWYSFMTMRPLFVIFLFYLLSGWKSPAANFSLRQKVIWLFPLVLMMFLTFVRTGFYLIPRYMAPSIPIMSIWASQFFFFDMGKIRTKDGLAQKKALIMWSLAALALIIALVVVSKQLDWAKYYKFTEPVLGAFDLRYNKLRLPQQILYVLVLMPLFVTVILITTTLSKKRGPIAFFVIWLSLFVLILCPLSHNIMKIDPGPDAGYMSNAMKSKFRYEPFKIFKDDMTFSKGDKVLISKDIHSRSWFLGRRADSHCHMLNIYFNEHFNYDQVTDGTLQDIVKADYNYAIITGKDWANIQKNKLAAKIQSRYQMKISQRLSIRSGPMQLILLKDKPPLRNN
ncbi:MAG: hypothetical protein J7K65_08020 [Planctomycetes bacterium]|nr:hypothetical protein [Planctomycetota bacterium]